MALVRVYNENVHPLSQMWNDEVVTIKPGGYVLMEEGEAIRFRGSYYPMTFLANKQPDPKSFKMIKIVPHRTDEPVQTKEKFICQMDGKEFDTKEELEAYIDENHLDNLADQDFASKRRKTKK